MTALAAVSLGLALIPAALFVANLFAFRRERPGGAGGSPVSVVIPARNEAANIAAAVRAALAARPLEVIVVDDQSGDDTPAIVHRLAAEDARVRPVAAPPLPPDWCGKPFACQVGADHARGELILFLDADVRLAPGALAALRRRLGANDLLSAFPFEATGTWLERLLLPLIPFVLLGFLPLARMRRSRHPAYAAGCGQVMLVRAAAYRDVGGHTAIGPSLMDGIALPRAFRRAGRPTDVCDGTDLAACRMYHGAREAWAGLAKNAGEGLGAPARIVPMTLVLAGGQVLPFALAAVADPPGRALALAACGLALLPRLVGVVRFRQSRLGALLHPVGVTLLLAVQWYALGRRALGRPAAWRGRTYAPAPAEFANPKPGARSHPQLAR